MHDVYDELFNRILGEGYATAYVCQASGMTVTEAFKTRYAEMLAFMAKDADFQALFDATLEGLRDPQSGSRDYRHMQFFVYELLAAFDLPEHAAVATRLVELAEKAGELRDMCYDAIFGIAAMALYEERFPPTEVDKLPSPMALHAA